MPRLPEAWNRAPDPTPEAVAAAVLAAPIEVLAEAVAGGGPDERFRVPADGDSLRFRCPLCDEPLFNRAPGARILDAYTWTCDACRVTGTRWLLALLARLGELLRRWELDGGDDAA